MKKMKKLAAFLLAAAMTLALAACQNDSSNKSSSAKSSDSAVESSNSSAESEQTSIDKIKADGYVTLATNAEFEPFEYKDGEGYKGIDIDIANKIAEKLGVELQIHDVAFSTVMPELSSGKANFVAAGLTATEDRQKNADFSETYFEAKQSIIVLNDSAIAKPADLTGKTVGVQEGTTGDIYCTNEDGKSEVSGIQVQRYNKGVDAVTDLISGRIDAVVIDDFPANKFVEKNPDKIKKLDDSLTTEEYVIAVQKGDAPMLEVVNEVLKELKDSGELQTIIGNYKEALEG